MFFITATGPVIGDPNLHDGDNGRYVEFTVKSKLRTKSVYITARFYGRKIQTIMRYIRNCDQITVAGQVLAIVEKVRAKDQMKYCQIYIAGADNSLPPVKTDGIPEERTMLSNAMIGSSNFAAASREKDEDVIF
jgi:hypothetical protein